MLHRAILGSFERFLGILIEHYAGRFPLWLAPVQAVVATIVSDADDYAARGGGDAGSGGAGGGLDLGREKIGAKVREHGGARPRASCGRAARRRRRAPSRCAGSATRRRRACRSPRPPTGLQRRRRRPI